MTPFLPSSPCHLPSISKSHCASFLPSVSPSDFSHSGALSCRVSLVHPCSCRFHHWPPMVYLYHGRHQLMSLLCSEVTGWLCSSGGPTASPRLPGLPAFGPTCGRESLVFSVQPRPSLGLSHWLLCPTGVPSLFFPIFFLPRAAQRAPRWRGLCAKSAPALPSALPVPCPISSSPWRPLPSGFSSSSCLFTVSTTVELHGVWAGLLHIPRAFNSMWHSGATIMNE